MFSMTVVALVLFMGNEDGFHVDLLWSSGVEACEDALSWLDVIGSESDVFC